MDDANITCEANNGNIDNFKDVFKYYKQKKKIPDLSRVLNFDTHDYKGIHTLSPMPYMDKIEHVSQRPFYLKPFEKWKISTLEGHPGLFHIANPFTCHGSVLWANKCIDEFTAPPHYTNLSHLGLSHDQNWWKSIHDCGSEQKSFRAMRWATMGYHHDWESKKYNLEESSHIPKDVESLCKIMLSMCGIDQHFKAEAAIVNFYPKGSSLGPHTDHSEPFLSAPLVSFSFGRSGVFLIGGISKSIEPTAMFLHHGDVLIMSGQSRLCYHALPMVLPDISLPRKRDNCKSTDNDLEASDSNGNIALSDTDCKGKKTVCNCPGDDVGSIINSYLKLQPGENFICPHCGRSDYSKEKVSDEFLETLRYIRLVRVNFNVRQVFKFS